VRKTDIKVSEAPTMDGPWAGQWVLRLKHDKQKTSHCLL